MIVLHFNAGEVTIHSSNVVSISNNISVSNIKWKKYHKDIVIAKFFFPLLFLLKLTLRGCRLQYLVTCINLYSSYCSGVILLTRLHNLPAGNFQEMMLQYKQSSFPFLLWRSYKYYFGDLQAYSLHL